MLEGLGALWYNDDRTRYVGASLISTMSSTSNASLGVYVHLWFPAMTAGYVWRSSAAGERGHAAVVSLDLYQFLSKSSTRLKDARDKAVQGKLSSLLK